MKGRRTLSSCAVWLLGAMLSAPTLAAQAPQDSTHRVATITGLSGPEAVRYDPDQDVWFVSNFNGDGGDRDANGFVTRAAADGSVETLRFAVGSEAQPLHAPRGMNITGDTLWVVDIDGLHAFDRRSGSQLFFMDLTGFSPGFLNDVTPGPGGALYVSDTGRSAVYRIHGRETHELIASAELGAPNGITRDPASGRLLVVPWRPGHPMHYISESGVTEVFGPATWPGRLDGVEPLDGGFIVASQSDTALYFVDADGARVLVRTPGTGADIALDARRRRVAVPYIGLDRVDIWELPSR